MKFPSLPHRIQICNSGAWIATLIALELLRTRKARQVFENGEFRGIELGHFGPMPAMLDKSPLPPVELPGIRFIDPRPGANYHRLVMSLQ